MTRPSDIEVIFAASPANGGLYIGDYLPVQPWNWPKETWFQHRLEKIRKEQNDER